MGVCVGVLRDYLCAGVVLYGLGLFCLAAGKEIKTWLKWQRDTSGFFPKSSAKDLTWCAGCLSHNSITVGRLLPLSCSLWYEPERMRSPSPHCSFKIWQSLSALQGERGHFSLFPEGDGRVPCSQRIRRSHGDAEEWAISWLLSAVTDGQCAIAIA